MTEIENQFAEWSQARASLKRIFERARVINVEEQCWRIFHLNLLRIYPLIPEYTALAAPEVSANIVAVINSEIPEIGAKLISQILAQAYSVLKLGAGDGQPPIPSGPVLMVAHLYKLGAIDAYPLFQTLVYLKKYRKWRLVTNILAVAGTQLAKASSQTYEYIKQDAGSHDTLETIDILIDGHKKKHSFDLAKLTLETVEFSLDPQWQAKTRQYKDIKIQILGQEEDSSEEESQDESDQEQAAAPPSQKPAPVIDTTNREQVALKKKIYLTIMSSISTQEACHKLLALGNRDTVVEMLFETCKQQKIYNKSFGSIGYHLCRASTEWPKSFQTTFQTVYQALENESTPEIRNMGTLSGYLLASDSMGWDVFASVKIDPENSTPSNRIFLQALFEELRREVGLKGISKRLLQLPTSVSGGVLPIHGDLKALMFSINYFTAIKMGPITDEMRLELQRRGH